MPKPEFPFMNFDYAGMMNGELGRLAKDFKMPTVNFDQAMAIQRKNMEALVAANQLAAEGFQTVARRQAEILRESVEDFTSGLKELMRSGSPEANAAKQAEVAKRAFERAMSNFRELAELATKSNSEAMDLLGKRMMQSIDEMKDMAPKK